MFHDALKQAQTADARCPKHERRTAKALYAEIRAAGYEGGNSRVTDFIRAWRQGEGQGAAANAFIPLAFELGEAYQFNWGTEGLVVGGIYCRAQRSHMKLCASRAFWLVAYPQSGPRDAGTLSHGLQMGDALIAATALDHGLPVLKANVKHFGAVQGLKVEAFTP